MEDVYAGLEGDTRAALRLQQLKGIVLMGERPLAAPDIAPAGVVMAQGVLEIDDIAPDAFADFDADPAISLANAAMEGAPVSEARASLAATPAAMDTGSNAPWQRAARARQNAWWTWRPRCSVTPSARTAWTRHSINNSLASALAARDAV